MGTDAELSRAVAFGRARGADAASGAIAGAEGGGGGNVCFAGRVGGRLRMGSVRERCPSC
jgi:hypothetical protein